MKERRKCACGCGEQFICDKDSQRIVIGGHKPPELAADQGVLSMREFQSAPAPEKKRRVRSVPKEMPQIESGIPIPTSGKRGPFTDLAERMKPGDSVLIGSDWAGALCAAIRKDGFRASTRADKDGMARVWKLEAPAPAAAAENSLGPLRG